MAGADYIYKYIGTVWDELPKKDKQRFSELWRGYEQTIADVYQRFLELDISLNVNKMPVYLTERWNKYGFNATNQEIVPAVFTSYTDISKKINTNTKHLIKITIDESITREIDCQGRNPSQTTIQEIVQKINSSFGFNLASTVFDDTLIKLTTVTKGPLASIKIEAPSSSLEDATELILGITPEEIPLKVPRLPYRYTLANPKIRDIPSLQNTIRNENLTYYIINGPDFEINWRENYISFKTMPPAALWAKVTYIDEEMPFYNYGYLIDYHDTSIDPEEYLTNVQGLWFAYWQGPRPEYIRRALCLLFGLPTAYSNGVVISNRGSLLDILHDDGLLRTYSLPDQLVWQVVPGDYVERFQPLTNGIDIYDKTNFPGFVRTEIGRSGIDVFALPEATKGVDPNTDESKALLLLEEHTFLPQINVNAFVRPNINVGSIFKFLATIKPLHKQFYFQVIIAIFGEDLIIDDKSVFEVNVDITPNLEINQANWSQDFERETYETTDNFPLDLDSDTLGFFDKLSMSFQDITGPLPQYDVVFD